MVPTATVVLGGRPRLTTSGYYTMMATFKPPPNTSGRSCYAHVTNLIVQPDNKVTISTTSDLMQIEGRVEVNGERYHINYTLASAFPDTGGKTNYDIYLPRGVYTIPDFVEMLNEELEVVDVSVTISDLNVLTFSANSIHGTINDTSDTNLFTLLGLSGPTFSIGASSTASDPLYDTIIVMLDQGTYNPAQFEQMIGEKLAACDITTIFEGGYFTFISKEGTPITITGTTETELLEFLGFPVTGSGTSDVLKAPYSATFTEPVTLDHSYYLTIDLPQPMSYASMNNLLDPQYNDPETPLICRDTPNRVFATYGSNQTSQPRILMDIPDGPQYVTINIYNAIGFIKDPFEIGHAGLIMELTPIDYGIKPDLDI